MKIANPIYDVVFKYLFEDKRVAMLIISRLIREDVVSLRLIRVTTEELGAGLSSVLHLVFLVKIRLETGDTQDINIDLKKAKCYADIQRIEHPFYGCDNYLLTKQIRFVESKSTKKDISVMTIRNGYYDAGTGAEVFTKSDFIEKMIPEVYIVQIPCLSVETRTSEVLDMLKVFEQTRVSSCGRHFLEIASDEFSDVLLPVVERLALAANDVAVCQGMELEG